MNRGSTLTTFIVTLFLAAIALAPAGALASPEPAHEVWMLDQSNTYDSNSNGTLDSGGTLYIFNGSELAGKIACT